MLPKFFGELIGLDFGRLPTLTVTGIEGRGMKAFKGPLRLQIAGLNLPPIPCLFAASDRTPKQIAHGLECKATQLPHSPIQAGIED